jgi:MFS family permease
MADPQNAGAAGRIVFRYPGFVLYQITRLCIVIAMQMQSVAVGWQIYEITRRPLDLGLVGLAQFLPSILLFLVSGHIADRFDRRKLLTLSCVGFAACWGALFFLAERSVHSVYPIYIVLILIGVVRSFSGPVTRAIVPQLVPEEHFPAAVAWSSTIFQGATILGPALGGLVYAFFRGPAAVYAIGVVSGICATVATLRIQTQSKPRPREPISLKTVLAGFHYIWNKKIILGSISLDLFAVLLGGAVALLPVYASEILKTGPWGLGLLRSAPGVGAGAMAIFLAYKPLRRRAGATMLWCVAGFGAFTIVFSLSRSLVLSLLALMLVGATDMVSVVVRGILIQVATPDEMRGRVNAVDMIFIGASNEFGQFESGVTAHWFGTVPAAVLGGIGAIVVTGLWAWYFPELRNADKLTATGD